MDIRAEIKKMSKMRMAMYILLLILAGVLWQVGIPVVALIAIWKLTKLSQKMKWVASIGFVLLFMIVLGSFAPKSVKTVITISEPKENFMADGYKGTIKGRVTPAKAELKINNEPLEKDADGNFTKEVDLPKPNNTFTITANADGNASHEVVVVKRVPTAEEKVQLDKEATEAKAKVEAEAEAERIRVQKEDDAVNAIVKKLIEKKDDIGKAIYYYDKSTPQRNDINNINLYIAESEETHLGHLRLKIQYEGNSWLFIQKYIIKADDQTFEIIPPQVERDNYTNVWEWSDFIPSDEQMQAVVAIVNSKEAKIRYQGQTYQKDRVITPAEKTALRNVIEAYKVMY